MRISDWSSDVCSSDLEVLKAAIPGCETIERLSDTEMTATVVTKVGPVKARFQGAVTLSELDPPNGYTISGEGKGGSADSGKDGAQGRMEEARGVTVLPFEMKDDGGGQLGKLGEGPIAGNGR